MKKKHSPFHFNHKWNEKLILYIFNQGWSWHWVILQWTINSLLRSSLLLCILCGNVCWGEGGVHYLPGEITSCEDLKKFLCNSSTQFCFLMNHTSLLSSSWYLILATCYKSWQTETFTSRGDDSINWDNFSPFTRISDVRSCKSKNCSDMRLCCYAEVDYTYLESNVLYAFAFKKFSIDF